MNGKLDPASNQDWQNYYRIADKRRRLAGWRRRGDSSTSKHKRKLDSSRVLAVVMGIATLTVILCLVIPT